jgi:glycosyltransferase involved in cell wall biosynthesis
MVTNALRGRETGVLFVIDDMGAGGAQKQIARIVRRLDRRRFRCGVVCLDRGGPALEELRGTAETRVLGAARIFDNRAMAAVARLAGIIRRGRYSVLEAYLPAAHFMCAAALPFARGAGLIAARRNLASLDPPWYAAASGILNAATGFSVANSHSVKESVVKRYRLRRSKVAVVPNVVEPTHAGVSKSEARVSFGIEEDEYVAAAVGRISREKDYETIIRAFAAMCGRGQKASLLIAGDGPGRRGVKALARRLGLNGQVRFLGHLDDPDPALAAADVFVHASRSEGASNAILESMAYGLPAVVSRIPSNVEVLGQCAGHYFEPGDWRGCLEGLWRCGGERSAGAKAQRRLWALFGGDRAMERRQRIYRKVGGGAR